MPSRTEQPVVPPTKWSYNFETAKREKLFKNPPADKTAYPFLQDAFRPHIDSFNAVFENDGLLDKAIKDIGTKTFLDGDPNSPNFDETAPRNRLSIRIKRWTLEKPMLPASNKMPTKRQIYPNECRERHSSYRGRFSVRLEWRINNGDWKEEVRDMGQLPIMLRSNRCHLENMTPAQMVNRREESEEFGGYFMVNGLEKLIRLLIVNKRNFPLAIQRPSFQNRGPSYSAYGVQIRSVRPDQTSQSNVIHYLHDGTIIFRFSWRKSEYLVPVLMIMKALQDVTDRDIFEGLLGGPGSAGLKDRQFVIDRVELLLRNYKTQYKMHSRDKHRAFLGSKFRPVLGLADDVPDEECGNEFLRKIVLPHLGTDGLSKDSDLDKSRMLSFMVRKLYALVEGECAVDNPDAVSNQEILLGGFLYGMLLKERLEEVLISLRSPLLEWIRQNPEKNFASPEFGIDFRSKIMRKNPEDIGRLIDYFLATGNLNSPTGLDLQQTTGFTIVAEKLNFYRFISHFRCVHRGSFFAQLKTTAVRKLLPESWGFLCPVHTPDGSPCGLLNHLSHKCKIATKSSDVSAIPDLIAGMGVVQTSTASLADSVVVQLDGKVLGFCTSKQARVIGDTLRYWKVEGSHNVPRELEIGFIPNSNGGQYPGVFMFSHPARMYRPTKYLPLDSLDYVGPFEQPYMSIACTDSEIVSGDSTHAEYDPTHILSIVANQTPFSDFNQSPRNMYQCQMGKQSMGTPGTALSHRSDNKVYRLQCGQTPVVRPPLHNEYGLDNFPNGTNAVVAVISYTGYDMDDAMILNKQSHERGFGYGSIYKTKKIDLEEDGGRKSRSKRSITKQFGFAPPLNSKGPDPVRERHRATLDDDGLPYLGRFVRKDDILYAYHSVQWDASEGKLKNANYHTHFQRYKEDEEAFIEEVRVLGSEDGSAGPATRVSIKFRIPRSPVIGDKFSSRHGQKGVCSQKWPTQDMPFSESGMVPDVIINPHAFPSRMTIGMFVESLAGKAGALHGFAQDSTPFKFEDKKGATAVEYFGTQLAAAGYNYYGNEPMYSGVTGEELHADIYIGLVYYQRLRHMVNDKFQVRTTGPVNQVTGQPVKGRSKGGGIRVGEMERDSLIAHGTAFLLQDRLMNCSDYAKTWICRKCGTFLSTSPTVAGYTASHTGGRGGGARGGRRPVAVRCRRCAEKATGMEPKNEVWEDGFGDRFTGGEDTAVVAVPGVLKYLDAELASMGVSMKFTVSAG